MSTASQYVVIRSVTANPRGRDAGADNGEYVLLTNVGTESVDVGNWAVVDAVGHRLTIRRGYVLPPGGDLRVYTATGVDTGDRVYAGKGAAILNNPGDTLRLLDSAGEVIQVFRY